MRATIIFTLVIVPFIGTNFSPVSAAPLGAKGHSELQSESPCGAARGRVYEDEIGGHRHKTLMDLVGEEVACAGDEALETAKAILGKSRSDQGVDPVLEGIGLVADTLAGSDKNSITSKQMSITSQKGH